MIHGEMATMTDQQEAQDWLEGSIARVVDELRASGLARELAEDELPHIIRLGLIAAMQRHGRCVTKSCARCER